MPNTTLSSREFNHDVGRAKKAALEGPVFITDRGRPSHVLLSVEAYRKLLANEPSIIDLLALPGSEDIEFEPVRTNSPLFRPADLS
ncbi:MAG: type II toxin-antitoxin system Phd/YefM family antitoxin [Proteobacteria bacterium]|nr:type II toxin-antitoxin system Phd/YefM family antitoxin [Pseudomonadota bacterium]